MKALIILAGVYFSYNGVIHQTDPMVDHCFEPYLAEGDNLVNMDKLTPDEYQEWAMCIAKAAQEGDK